MANVIELTLLFTDMSHSEDWIHLDDKEHVLGIMLGLKDQA